MKQVKGEAVNQLFFVICSVTGNKIKKITMNLSLCFPVSTWKFMLVFTDL